MSKTVAVDKCYVINSIREFIFGMDKNNEQLDQINSEKISGNQPLNNNRITIYQGGDWKDSARSDPSINQKKKPLFEAFFSLSFYHSLPVKDYDIWFRLNTGYKFTKFWS